MCSSDPLIHWEWVYVSLDALEDLAQNVILTRYSANNVISQQGDRGNRYVCILVTALTSR